MVRVLRYQEVLHGAELRQAEEDVLEAMVVELVELGLVLVLDPGYDVPEHEHSPVCEERVPIPALRPVSAIARALVEPAGLGLCVTDGPLHLHRMNNPTGKSTQVISFVRSTRLCSSVGRAIVS
eukprot:XP_001706704.1 Hypothetical protein GL50803_31675 [Giardia lamblia ATCC 50803]